LRRILPRFQDENITHNFSIINNIREIAQSKGVTLAQIALAWVLAQGEHVVAIPGAKSINHLEENVNATHINLSQDELLQIDKLIPIGFAQGALLPEPFAQFSNR
jgi:aryl-alcohol dehydrogenase-like predicted oxidoreductase